MHYIENHASFNLGLTCNEFFFWLAFDSVSYNRPSHVQTREKAELELLTGTITKSVDRCKRKSSFAVSIFRLFKGVFDLLVCFPFQRHLSRKWKEDSYPSVLCIIFEFKLNICLGVYLPVGVSFKLISCNNPVLSTFLQTTVHLELFSYKKK